MPVTRVASSSLVGLLLASALCPAVAVAWGYDGHRIVGEIAWSLLEPEVREAARELLPPGRYGSLAEASIWADSQARAIPRYEWLAPLHYVNADPSAESVVVEASCNCVIEGIARFAAVLGDPLQPYQSRVDALRLVAHFVGDVHQPLHAGHPDGHGGGSVDVVFEGERQSLHRLWDTSLLQTLLEAREQAGSLPGWRAEATALLGGLTDTQVESWSAQVEPAAWATESLRLGQEHIFRIASGDVIEPVDVEPAAAVIRLRLAQAGVRLAMLLNSLLR